ncbi:uncharacterized protein PG998_012862 [Apiospora kogelbergensis]|uniref:uncharacterized protein n=1 Tax=Apiospora kogelbergensis TaxID=1337665 RepID=UPI00312F72DF
MSSQDFQDNAKLQPWLVDFKVSLPTSPTRSDQRPDWLQPVSGASDTSSNTLLRVEFLDLFVTRQSVQDIASPFKSRTPLS